MEHRPEENKITLKRSFQEFLSGYKVSCNMLVVKYLFFLLHRRRVLFLSLRSFAEICFISLETHIPPPQVTLRLSIFSIKKWS